MTVSAGAWLPIAIFVVITLESAAFLGLLVPGETVAIMAGALAGAQILNPYLALVVVAAGAMSGDVLGYVIGERWGAGMLARFAYARRHYQRNRGWLETYFARFGSASVFTGRFFAVGRALIPFFAGLSGMAPGRFVLMAALAALSWGGVMVGLGYVLGRDWPLVMQAARFMGGGIALMVVFTGAMIWLWRFTLARRDTLLALWQRLAAEPLERRWGMRLAPLWDFVSARFSPTGYLGLHLTMGLAVIVLGLWLFGAVVQDLFAQDPLVSVDQAVRQSLAALRTPALDAVMAAAAMPGNPEVVASCAVAGAVVFGFLCEPLAALTVIVAVAGGYAIGLGMRMLFAGFKPYVPSAMLVHGFAGFPSVTLSATVAAYGILWYFAMSSVRDWRLQTLGTVAFVYLLILVALGALYRTEPLSGVLGGLALGTTWLAVCVSGAAMRSRLRIVTQPP